MSNVLTLTSPLMRRTVGFDRLNDMFETLLSDSAGTAEAYPPYNIEKLGDDEYRITMAVAGFTMEDLSIVVEGGELSIAGSITDKGDEDVEYLHKGIANRAFERKFRLADHIEVTGASLDHGLLMIDLVREIPEEKKARKIEIGSGLKKLSGKKKK